MLQSTDFENRKNERARATHAVAQWREEIEKMKRIFTLFVATLFCLPVMGGNRKGNSKKTDQHIWSVPSLSPTGLNVIQVLKQDLLPISESEREGFLKAIQQNIFAVISLQDGLEFSAMSAGPRDSVKVIRNVVVAFKKFAADADERQALLYWFTDGTGQRRYLALPRACNNVLVGVKNPPTEWVNLVPVASRAVSPAKSNADSAAWKASWSKFIASISVEQPFNPWRSSEVVLANEPDPDELPVNYFYRVVPEGPTGLYSKGSLSGHSAPSRGLVNPLNGGEQYLEFGFPASQAAAADSYWVARVGVRQKLLRRYQSRLFGYGDLSYVANAPSLLLGLREVGKRHEMYFLVGGDFLLGLPQLSLAIDSRFLFKSLWLLNLNFRLDSRFGDKGVVISGHYLAVDGQLTRIIRGNDLDQDRVGIEFGVEAANKWKGVKWSNLQLIGFWKLGAKWEWLWSVGPISRLTPYLSAGLIFNQVDQYYYLKAGADILFIRNLVYREK